MHGAKATIHENRNCLTYDGVTCQDFVDRNIPGLEVDRIWVCGVVRKCEGACTVHKKFFCLTYFQVEGGVNVNIGQ